MQLSAFTPDHAEEVIKLFTSVFSDSEGKDEGAVIGALVREMINSTPPEELQGFMAKEDNQTIGAIFYSRFTLPSNKVAFILSPVAVSTGVQGKGVGQQLIRFGIKAMKAQGVEILLTYGDPNYYSKTGFQQITETLIPAPLELSFPHGWLAQSLTGKEITPEVGNTSCVSALNHQKYW
ncbi:GNAT family N-acetyltransferase [Amphritea balenae]|uniref:N-acetyltransferase n=1 Tax=Amphritea balenae TaxID=452629 RepID=A0A3P1SW59_9GAMM|nr:N-acetyltransferase [Amphritea balenae]RRD01447.1 N-acetyltransferase [Amphritea balenae]GGK57035.1 N-acetyltransferase [Amphritea balenae]